jgi:hypothetical protein
MAILTAWAGIGPVRKSLSNLRRLGYFVYENILILLHPSGPGAITDPGLYGLTVTEARRYSPQLLMRAVAAVCCPIRSRSTTRT